MPQVFLSHSHADKPFVRRLATDLSVMGADIWIDEVELKVGDSLLARIGAGITASDFVAAILSRHSVGSTWVTQELEIALTLQIGGAAMRVLPIRLDDAPLPPFLLGKLYCDFSSGRDYRGALLELTRAIGVEPTARKAESGARWYCGYCGWACDDSSNDYLCGACGAVRLQPIGSSTMVKCRACDTFSLLVAAYCDNCGSFFGFRRFGD
jgi:hypothetical protein